MTMENIAQVFQAIVDKKVRTIEFPDGRVYRIWTERIDENGLDPEVVYNDQSRSTEQS